MSESRKIMWLIWIQACGQCAMRVLAAASILCMFVSVALAVDVADAGAAVTVAERAGALEVQGVWALFAGTLFVALVLMGWGVWAAQVKVQEKLSDIAADIAAIRTAKPICQGADAINAVLNAARTELERTAMMLRGGK